MVSLIPTKKANKALKMTLQSIVDNIKSGKKVTFCGDEVTLEGVSDWQEKKLWINLKNGASYIASWREIKSMDIH
jgi:hypothetical protein